jgi:hypothetical protein
MPEKKCRSCAMMIPAEAKICPYCRKGQAGFAKLFYIALGVTVVLIVISLAVPEKTKINDPISLHSKMIYLSKKTPFKIIGRGDVGGKGLSMSIIVPGKMKKEEVMRLAEEIRNSSDGKYLYVQIFDLEEAQRNQANDKYPEKKYWKHFLVDIAVNPSTGMNRIAWVAEGRNH